MDEDANGYAAHVVAYVREQLTCPGCAGFIDPGPDGNGWVACSTCWDLVGGTEPVYTEVERRIGKCEDDIEHEVLYPEVAKVLREHVKAAKAEKAAGKKAAEMQERVLARMRATYGGRVLADDRAHDLLCEAARREKVAHECEVCGVASQAKLFESERIVCSPCQVRGFANRNGESYYGASWYENRELKTRSLLDVAIQHMLGLYSAACNSGSRSQCPTCGGDKGSIYRAICDACCAKGRAADPNWTTLSDWNRVEALRKAKLQEGSNRAVEFHVFGGDEAPHIPQYDTLAAGGPGVVTPVTATYPLFSAPTTPAPASAPAPYEGPVARILRRGRP